jgi:hypothetical protein
VWVGGWVGGRGEGREGQKEKGAGGMEGVLGLNEAMRPYLSK